MSKGSVGRSPKMIQNVFVLLLLSLFAILSTFLVTVGAQLYRNTVEGAERNNAVRIVTTVLRSTIWAEDGGEGEIKIETFHRGGEEIKTLSMIRQYSDSKEDAWVKRVYVYDGCLREGYTPYYRIIRRKDLKPGQEFFEIGEDAEFLEADEIENEDEMFEEAVRAEAKGGNGENSTGNPDDLVYVVRGFRPADDGEPLCDLAGFDPSRSGRMLTVQMETTDHQTSTVRMYMRTGGAD